MRTWPNADEIPPWELRKQAEAAERYRAAILGEITIIARGVPKPQGSKKGFSREGSTKVAMVESCKTLPVWRKAVTEAAIGVRNTIENFAALDGPLIARATFTMPKPKKPKFPDGPATYPDLSKILRSTEDAIKDGGIIADDARIIGYERLWKCWPNDPTEQDALDEPGVVIRVRPYRKPASVINLHYRGRAAA